MIHGLKLPRFGLIDPIWRMDPLDFASPMDCQNDHLIDAYGGVHRVYDLQSITTEVLSKAAQRELEEKLFTLLKSLPSGIDELEFSISSNKSYRTYIEQFVGYDQKIELLQKLRQNSAEEYFRQDREGEITRCSIQLIMGCSFLKKNIKGKYLRVPPTLDEYQMARKTLDMGEGALISESQTLGMTLRRLQEREMAQLFYETTEIEKARDIGLPLRFVDGKTPFSEAWLQSEINDRPHGVSRMIKWGGYYHALVTLNGQPLTSVPRQMDSFTSALPFRQFRVTHKLRRVNQTEILKEIDQKSRWMMSAYRTPMSVMDSGAKGEEKIQAERVSQQFKTSEASGLSSLAELKKAIDLKTTEVVECCTQFHIWHSSPDELNKRLQILQGRINADLQSASGYVEDNSLLPLFFHSMPAAGAPWAEPKYYSRQGATSLIPLSKGFETQDKPVLMFHTSSGGLVGINPEDTSVADAPINLITGATGSGKSVLMNKILMEVSREDTPVIGLDFGDSYSGVAAMLGIPVFKVTSDDPSPLNPFQVFDQGNSPYVVEPSPLERRQICLILENFITEEADGKHGLSKELRVYLDEVVEQTYINAQGKAPFIRLSDLSKQCDNRNDTIAREIKMRLQPYLRGQAYGHLFDEGMRHRFTNKFIIDLSGIKEDQLLARCMVPLCFSIIDHHVLRSRDIHKIVFFEEIFQFVKDPVFMKNVIDRVKTFRKENTETYMLMQAMADLCGDKEMAEQFFTAVYTYYVFEQGEGKERCRDILSLNEGQFEVLKSFRDSRKINDNGLPEMFRECLMVRGKGQKRQSGRLRVKMTPEMAWIATSSPKQYHLREDAIKSCGGDAWQAIQTLAKKYPLGIIEEKGRFA